MINFNGTDGANALSGVTDVNGTLYGTTQNGGTHKDSVLYSYDIATGQVQTVVSFNSTTGYAPFDGVTDVGGTLYATTSEGGKSSGGTLFSYRIPCFAEGTRILMAQGEVPVEDLRLGMDVVCSDGVLSRIVWLGHRAINITGHPKPEAVLPVLIEAGALDDGIPSRDLLLSPDHAVCLRGRLIPAKVLINGATIRQVDRSAVTYYHVELEAHVVLVADGAPCESYLETGNRDAFANGGGGAVAS